MWKKKIILISKAVIHVDHEKECLPEVDGVVDTKEGECEARIEIDLVSHKGNGHRDESNDR